MLVERRERAAQVAEAGPQVGRRLADVDMVAENLRQTAEVFDRGDEASSSELDQMIWAESDY